MKLQLALDVIDTGEALRVAEVAHDFVDLIEIGTPLLKHEGVSVIETMCRRFPDKPIVVDAKTMDAGACEADFCFTAGAAAVTVLGVAGSATIEAVVLSADRHGGKAIVDLLGVADKAQMTTEAISLGARLVVLHTGIDQQRGGSSVLAELARFIPQLRGAPFAVAGGITPSSLRTVVTYRPDIVIVGAAISHAEHPEAVARELKEVLNAARSNRSRRLVC